jgi:hypothetical protein
MGSDLHEKLKAARQAAGVTRGSVTQWESTNPETRTQPSTDKLEKIASTMNVPAGWFVDGNSNVSDLQFVKQEFSGSHIGALNIVKGAQPEPHTPPLGPSQPTSESLPRMAQAFFRSAEFEVLRHAPGAEKYFEQALAPFATSRDIVIFCAPSCDIAAVVGKALLAERLAGSEMRLHLAIFAPPGTALPKAEQQLCEQARVKAHLFREPVDCAKFLLTLLKQ